MRTSDLITCTNFPCLDVDKTKYIIPQVEVNPESIQMILISEATPQSSYDYYYQGGEALFERTTLQAFRDAGIQAKSFNELVKKGVYFTTAIKCDKKGSIVKSVTLKNCSFHLEMEMVLFPEVKVIMLMGDFAIKVFNQITLRQIGRKVIPSGSTYKTRTQEYFFKKARVFPSYLQAGAAFYIEQSKRHMIEENLNEAFKILGWVS